MKSYLVWKFNREDVPVPSYVFENAKRAGSGKVSFDKRTKSYKILKDWAISYSLTNWGVVNG